MGKPVDWKQSDKRITLTVTGILRDLPENSHLQFDFLASQEILKSDPAFSNNFNNWSSFTFAAYLELEKGRTRESVEKLLPPLLSKLSASGDEKLSKDQLYSLQPLTDIHLKSALFWGGPAGGEIQNVRLFLAIAFLILLIACINHVNLATARSASRSREIGIRKVTGACRTQIFQQFLAESFFIAGLAGILAMGLLAFGRPWFQALVGLSWRPGSFGFGGLWPWLAATVIFVGLSAGLYPAFVLSGLQPVRTLREFTATGRKGALLRSLMVVFQYTSAVVLIAATVVVFGQMKYVRSLRLGYDRENVVVLPIKDGETKGKLEAIKAAFLQRPEVLKCSLTNHVPTKLGMYLGGVTIEGEAGEKVKQDFRAYDVDENFVDVFGIELAAGRNFSSRQAGDRNAIMMNETAVRAIGWTTAPVGRTIKIGGAEHTLVGIVKDFHSGSLHEPIQPLLIFSGKGEANIAVRLRPGELTRMISVLKDIFEKNGSGQPFDFYFLDDAFNALYNKEIRTGKIFGAFASLAVLIAGLGLLGLTAFNVSARTKEIGIRKVLGASAARIYLLLNRDFIRLVVIANLIAWPLAYYFMSRWLRIFAYRIAVRPWIFLLSTAFSLAVALLVIGGQTVRAARSNPVTALRAE
jgi:putative ABC transport system permease protein